MHIPDGFLSLPVAAGTYVASGGSLAYAVRRTTAGLREKQVPLMGVMGAFIFAAQMLNFPVAGGTSGHLIGAALATILLGPWAGMLIMTSVLIVQALIFQDGGLLALGANVLNMGVVACLIASVAYTGMVRFLGTGKRAVLASGFVAAWASVVAAAVLCALELALSGIAALAVVLPAMTLIHVLIGIGEGMVTAGVMVFLTATRRDLLQLETS
jgi:cobalt/nickel transport system permease protein